jgi:hypothetical protein
MYLLVTDSTMTLSCKSQSIVRKGTESTAVEMYKLLMAEALCYKLEGRGFDFLCSQWILTIDLIFPAELWPWCRLSL